MAKWRRGRGRKRAASMYWYADRAPEPDPYTHDNPDAIVAGLMAMEVGRNDGATAGVGRPGCDDEMASQSELASRAPVVLETADAAQGEAHSTEVSRWLAE